MAWRSSGRVGKGKGKKGQRKPQPEEADEQPNYLKAVDPRWNLNKAALRGYASVAGSPFYAAQGQTDSEFLALPNILGKLQPYTSDIANRLARAFSTSMQWRLPRLAPSWAYKG